MSPVQIESEKQYPINHNLPPKVRLVLSRIDPWSAMKIGFLLSIALSIIMIVGTFLLWYVLDAMHMWANLEGILQTLGSEKFMKLLDFVRLDRVMAISTLIGVINVILITAISTISAFIYNICAALVGGLKVTIGSE